MDMVEQLSDLRQTLPGCHLAAFIDLSARMVLAHEARSKAPQERLDGLADRAARLLTTPDVATPSPDHALAVSDHNIEIFLRAAPDADDSLALVCSNDTDAEAAVDAGFAFLRSGAPDV